MKHLARFVLGVTAVVAFSFSPWISRAVADEWQPIDPADLAMKDNPRNPGANAMVLYRETRVNEPLAYRQECVRMKIFTKEGVKYASVEVPYDKSSEKIVDIQGRTIHADGTIVNFDGKALDKVLVKSGGVKVYAKTFSLPDVQPGSIIDYRYQYQVDEQRYYIGRETWSPQGELFTRFVRFSILPLSGMRATGVQLSYRYSNISEKVKPELQPNGYLQVELHDMPGVEEEELMPPAAAIRPRIEFYYRDSGEPANQTKEQYWKRIDKKWNDELEKFIGKKKALENEVSRVVAANDTAEAKLRKIYTRVMQIRNISMETEKSKQEQQHENLKTNSNVEDVLNRGYGYGREINMLLIGLARAAGFDAAEVYVAPVNSVIFTPATQEESQLSADLTWVRAGGQEYFLDPGARYFSFGLLPWYETETAGIRLRKDAPEFINVPAMKSTDAMLVRNCDLQVNENGDATGKLRVDFAGELAGLRRMQQRHEDETGRKKELGDEIRGWLPAGSLFEVTAISNWDDITQPIRVEGTLKMSGAGTPVGRRMLVPMTLFQATQTNAFKSSKRVNDVFFSYRFEEMDDVKYQAPSNYTIDSVPTIPKIDLNAVIYEIGATKDGNTVETKRHLTLQATVFAPKYYQALRTFFNAVKSNDETQLVLLSSEPAKAN